jgi:hypothetical protein
MLPKNDKVHLITSARHRAQSASLQPESCQPESKIFSEAACAWSWCLGCEFSFGSSNALHVYDWHRQSRGDINKQQTKFCHKPFGMAAHGLHIVCARCCILPCASQNNLILTMNHVYMDIHEPASQPASQYLQKTPQYQHLFPACGNSPLPANGVAVPAKIMSLK